MFKKQMQTLLLLSIWGGNVLQGFSKPTTFRDGDTTRHSLAVPVPQVFPAAQLRNFPELERYVEQAHVPTSESS
jgi:hypothetical protein